MKTYSNFTQAYHGLLKEVYAHPEHEAAPRGMKIKERLGHSFRITDIRDRIPYIPHREFSIAYMIAELVWYLSGNNSMEWISNYAPFWRNISDDGTTANSAYGARIFKQHPYQSSYTVSDVMGPFDNIPHEWTQWQYLKDELKKDPDSRRAVLHIRMPQDSYLAHKDVPCTLALQFFIRDGALHQVASMRSSDLVLGIAYDVPAFTIFQELLALELGVECGSYTHISNSLHIYSKHYPLVEKILNDPWVKEFPGRAKPMPHMPNLPPLNVIERFESCLRSANTESELTLFLDSAFSETVLDRYWIDWLLILAWHRAGKLELTQLQQELMTKVNFSGFKLFNK